jgi:hypothetical protein
MPEPKGPQFRRDPRRQLTVPAFGEFEALVDATYPGEHVSEEEHWCKTLERCRPDLLLKLADAGKHPLTRSPNQDSKGSSKLDHARAFVYRNWYD